MIKRLLPTVTDSDQGNSDSMYVCYGHAAKRTKEIRIACMFVMDTLQNGRMNQLFDLWDSDHSGDLTLKKWFSDSERFLNFSHAPRKKKIEFVELAIRSCRKVP